MSDIKVGDLVIVVRPTICCGNGNPLGEIHVVGANYRGASWCVFCGAPRHHANAVFLDNRHVIEVSRLRKIDPLSEPESVEQLEEMPA